MDAKKASIVVYVQNAVTPQAVKQRKMKTKKLLFVEELLLLDEQLAKMRFAMTFDLYLYDSLLVSKQTDY